MKYLFPIINLVIAGALFFMFTDQMMVNAPLNEQVVDAKSGKIDLTQSKGGIRALLARQTELSDAVTMAKAVNARITDLSGTYNNFAMADLTRLDELLPDHVDNIQLIIDVNGIAKENGMAIKNIRVATGENGDMPDRKLVAVPDPSLGAMILSFSVTGTYEAYKKFLTDLASSLRLIDISSVAFATDEKGIYTYNVSLKTYWLK
ncbi:MAG: type 4a pilus biogenesis protein PilO [Candidatus Vogelbacteria bacterium]|nr:type 4a pilus biogenesis protein PilO [Candidatus Vogelbacteria bacterium]